MTPIIFRAEAERDLLEIHSYYCEFSEDTAKRVLEDIYRAIDQLAYFPRSARKVEGREFRRIVSRKYRFMIAHVSTDEAVTIIGIHRYQDRES